MLCPWTTEAPSLELVAETLWFVWKERNKAIFRKKTPDPRGVVTETLAKHENFSIWNSNQEKRVGERLYLVIPMASPCPEIAENQR